MISSQSVLLGAAALAVVLLWVQVHVGTKKRITRHGKPLRNSPKTLPLVGNGILFLQAREKLLSWAVKCERLHGYETLALSVPTLPPAVLINDPKNLEYVFKNESSFTKGDFVKRRTWDLFGNGIINASGESWKIQRKAGLNFLNTANLKVLTHVALPQNLATVTAYVRARSGSVVDLQHVFHEITTMLMGKLAYNIEDMHADDGFSRSFDYASGKTAERFQNPLWPITELFLGARFRASIATVKSFGAGLVTRAVHDQQHRAKAGCDDANNTQLDAISGSLIQSLLDVIGREDLVADAALNYLTAGRDTVAQALTWCFYELLRHPCIAAELRQEVQRVAAAGGGDDDDVGNAGAGGDSTTASTLHATGDGGLDSLEPTRFTPAAMPYTMAVFYETLRLHPPIPFEIRQCARATTLPDGTFLPVGSVLVWCVWAFGRSMTTWGSDVDDFRPERWFRKGTGGEREGSVSSRPPSEYPVFNGGPRTCLGIKMAEVVFVQCIATMTALFDFEPVDARERRSKSSLTLPMDGGLPVVVHVRVRSRGLTRPR